MAMLDLHTYEWILEEGGAVNKTGYIVTQDRTWKNIIGKYRTSEMEFVSVEQIYDLCEQRWTEKYEAIWHQWTKGKSAFTGLTTAMAGGAEHIDVYGMDMHGDKDWDGTKREEQRRKWRRWDAEKVQIGNLTRAFSKVGITIRRVDKEAEHVE